MIEFFFLIFFSFFILPLVPNWFVNNSKLKLKAGRDRAVDLRESTTCVHIDTTRCVTTLIDRLANDKLLVSRIFSIFANAHEISDNY